MKQNIAQSIPFSREENACIQAVCKAIPKKGIVLLHTKSCCEGYRAVVGISKYLGLEMEFVTWKADMSIHVVPDTKNRILVIDAIGSGICPDKIAADFESTRQEWYGILILTDGASDNLYLIPGRKDLENLNRLEKLTNQLKSWGYCEWEMANKFAALAEAFAKDDAPIHAAICYGYAIRVLGEDDDTNDLFRLYGRRIVEILSSVKE